VGKDDLDVLAGVLKQSAMTRAHRFEIADVAVGGSRDTAIVRTDASVPPRLVAAARGGE